jgi:hypothetical protein
MSISIEEAFALLQKSHEEVSLTKQTKSLVQESRRPMREAPASSSPKSSKGRGRPAKLWICDSDGVVTVQDFPSSKAAQEAGLEAADNREVRWARAFNDKTGKIFIGEGWVYTPQPWEKANNMPLKYWTQLTAPERHKVKETEIPKYKKPGVAFKDLSVKNPKWQSVGTSRRGQTYDRRNRSQGIPDKNRMDFGKFPFVEKS